MAVLRARGQCDVSEVKFGSTLMEWERDREWDWGRDALPLEQALRDKLKRCYIRYVLLVASPLTALICLPTVSRLSLPRCLQQRP